MGKIMNLGKNILKSLIRKIGDPLESKGESIGSYYVWFIGRDSIYWMVYNAVANNMIRPIKTQKSKGKNEYW